MRLKGRYISDRQFGGIKEVDCGMGLRELKKEIDYFVMMPKRTAKEMDKRQMKNICIVGSLTAAGFIAGVSLVTGGVVGGAIFIICLAYMGCVAGANIKGRVI